MSPAQLTLAASPEPSEEECRPQVQAHPTPLRGRKAINWDWAATLLARGYQMGVVAQQLGISRTTLWRALKQSPELRRMVAAQQAEMAVEAGAPLHALRTDVAQLIREKLGEGDTRVLIWLANKLGIMGTNYLNDKDVAEAEPKKLAEDAALAKLAEEEWAEEQKPEHEREPGWAPVTERDRERTFGVDWALAQEHAADRPGRVAELVTGESDVMRAYRDKEEKERNERRIREYDKANRKLYRGCY